MNNHEIAKQVISALGGPNNIECVTHCATRLRVMVHNADIIDQAKLECIDKVQGSFFNSGQYQIIFGTGTVNKIYDEVVSLGLPTTSEKDMKALTQKHANPIQRGIRTFGDVFVPIIPVIVATGLFMGVRGLLNALGLSLPADINTYSQILTDTAFVILPGLVVWSTFCVFGASPSVGIVLGMMLVSGSLPNAWAVASGSEVHAMQFFGCIPVVGLQGSVLPAFIIGVIGAHFEKFIRKMVPDVLDLLITPFTTLLVMSILGLFVIGPVFHLVETYILVFTKTVLNLPLGLGGLLIGGVHQLIVVSGVHHIFNLLEVQLLAADHANPFNAIITAAMTAQGAATVAVGVKTHNSKLKTLAFPAALSAFLGITEPAIFGVNLRFRKPFFLSLIAGALGGCLASNLGLAGTGNGITIIPGAMLYIGNGQLLQYILLVFVSFVLGFILTYLFGYEDEDDSISTDAHVSDASKTRKNIQKNTLDNIQILKTPVSGKVINLEDVADPCFSKGLMGPGVAIAPSDGTVYAPSDGVVTVVSDTGHCYGMKTDQGAEILIHIGIDTVSMNGEGFNSRVSQGDKVCAGDILGTFDSQKIVSCGLDNTTMIIITNMDSYHSFTVLANGTIGKNENIIEIKQ